MARVLPRTDPILSLAAEREAVHVLRELLRSSDPKLQLRAAKTLLALWRHYARLRVRPIEPKG